MNNVDETAEATAEQIRRFSAVIVTRDDIPLAAQNALLRCLIGLLEAVNAHEAAINDALKRVADVLDE